jgi:hypothetical protein
MLPTKFRFIWQSGFRGEDLKKLANQKQELPMAATFVNESGQNEHSLERTFHRCFLPSFSCFSGARSRSTRREPPTMGKQLVNFKTCGCESSAPFFVIYWYHMLCSKGLGSLLKTTTHTSLCSPV